MPEPATRRIAASVVRRSFSQLLNQVARGEPRIIVEKHGAPVAAIIAAQDLDRLSAPAGPPAGLSNEMQERLRSVLRRHAVVRASLFGSFARGEGRAGSDIDLLVEMPAAKDLFDLVGLKLDVEGALGRPAHVVTFRALDSRVREQVLDDQQTIL